jgi:hypothetical protein
MWTLGMTARGSHGFEVVQRLALPCIRLTSGGSFVDVVLESKVAVSGTVFHKGL